MKKSLYFALTLALCLALLLTGCNKKAAEEPDNTVGGIMGDLYISVTDSTFGVGDTTVGALQDNITLSQTKYANVYQVSGKLNYQHDFTSFSQDALLRNGFYLTFDLCAPADIDLTDIAVTVKSGAEGILRSFSGADFKDGKLSVTERIISEDGESYENILVTFDLDGQGDKYRAETYTLDLGNIDATFTAFVFGEWPSTYYYPQVTLEEFTEAGQKLVARYDFAGLAITSVAATIDLYELFLEPQNLNDFEFTTYSTSKTVNSYISQNSYDFIFIQSGRYHTLRNKETNKSNISAAVKLCRLASLRNPEVEAVVVAPYGVQTRFDLLAETVYGAVSTTAQHVEAINKEADAMAKAISDSGYITSPVSVAYAGNAFASYSDDPAVIKEDLYGLADGMTGFATNQNKASAAGAYLMAAAVYSTAFDASPVGLGVFGPEYYDLNASLKGEDRMVLALLEKYNLTPEELALKLQTVAYKSCGGTAEEQTFAVSFNSNGGSEVEPITAALGATLNAPSAPTRAGYTFCGWYADKALTKQIEFYLDTMALGGMTLYARWEKAGDTSYTIEHYVEGTDGKYTLYKTDTARVSDKDTLVYGTLLGEEGYVYNPTHKDGRASAMVSADGKAKLKLYYDRAEYLVSYEYAEDYSNVPNLPQEFYAKYGDTVKLASKLTMDGKVFVGWTSDDDLVGDTSFTMPAGDVVLNGLWFDSVACPTISVASGSVYGKEVTSLQTDIKVSGLAVTGTLNYVSNYEGYLEQVDTSNMEMVEYAPFKYGYGYYLALNFKWPESAKSGATITFGEGYDARIFEKSKGNFTVALKVNEYGDNIPFTVDLDGKGDTYTYQLELSGVKIASIPGFDALLAVANAYDARGSLLQYETYSMGKTSTGMGFGEYRHDDGGVAEVGTSQYIMHLDCTRWTYALNKNAIGYDFNGLDDPTTQIKLKSVQAYAYEVTGKESKDYQQAILDEYLSILQPGDIVSYLYGNEGSGHVMVYVGNNTLMHCAGGSFREGGRLSTLTGKPYDMDDVGGSIKIDSLDIIKNPGHSNALFSSSNPKYFIAILRPLMMEDAHVTEYGKLHETYPNLYIEKTTSHPQGFAAQVGEEIEFTISFENRGAGDITLTVENLIPEGATASIVKGNPTETITINSFDSKVIHVTYRIEEAVTDWMEESGYNRVYFDTKVNGALINSLNVTVNKMLTAQQQEKVKALDLTTLTSTNDFDLMVEFYQKALGYDLTSKLEGCTDFDGILRKLFDAHTNSDYMTINYDLSGSTGDLMSMHAPGMYGGVRVRSTGPEDHAVRVKRLTDKSFAVGDIIIYSGNATSKATQFTENAGMYIYLGNEWFLHYDNGIELIRANGRDNICIAFQGTKMYATDRLAQLCGAGTFIMLRPAQVMD